MGISSLKKKEEAEVGDTRACQGSETKQSHVVSRKRIEHRLRDCSELHRLKSGAWKLHGWILKVRFDAPWIIYSA